jgi:outer membrane protein OmpA-like peptidoglycan-associated protein
MKTLLAFLIAGLAAGDVAAGPDFESRNPHGKPLAASSGYNELLPADDVIFKFDSDQLTDSGVAQVDTAARWLAQNRRMTIVVEGYADHVGYADYNEDLATRRAQTVRHALMKRGISSDRVLVVVYGEEVADPAGNPLDRRVIMYASPWPRQQLIRASLGRKQALVAMWTDKNAAFTETRGTSNVKTIATR